jgi:DNA-directed RNA polymerase specialized sigma24 family protein
LIMVAADLPHEEIADRLGVTEKSVERMVAYHRERMRKKGFA